MEDPRGSSTLLLPIIVAGMLVFSASSALAKGPESATLTGPGLDGPVELDTTASGSLGRAMEQTGLWWSSGGDRPRRLDEPPPRSELGPRYTLMWALYEEEPTIRQLIFPFAQGGVIVHTPIQEAVRGVAQGAGWFQAPALQETLARLGVAVAGASSPGDVPPREISGQSPGRRPVAAPSYVAFVALLAALMAALITGRTLPRAHGRSRGAYLSELSS